MTSSKIWLLSSNEGQFRLNDWLETHNYVYWRQYVSLSPGDLVYIYSAKPTGKITMLFEVAESDLPDYAERSSIEEYYVNPDEIPAATRFAKFNLLKRTDSDALALENLYEHGLNNAPERGYTIDGELLNYIIKNF